MTESQYSISNKQFKISLSTLLNTENIATLLDKEDKARIVTLIEATYQTDKTQSASIMDEMEKYMKLAMQIIEPSSSTNQKYNNNIPLILQAAINFNADAFPALTKGGQIAKFFPVGSDKDIIGLDEKGEELIDPETNQPIIEQKGGTKQAKASRVQKYINYFLRKRMKKFIPDIDRLTLIYAITGSIFKKTYFNPYTNLPDSKLVMPNNIIVNPAAEDMENYPVSEEIFYTQNELKQKMVSGHFIKYDIEELSKGNYQESNANNQNTTEDVRLFSDNDALIKVIEQHCLIDLDGDGYKEPYIISIVGSKLLSIQKRYNKASIKRSDEKIIEIQAKILYTHYKFMPDPRGTFYGLGFGFLLHKFNNTLNSSLNQLLKAAYRANMERGLFDKDKLNWGKDVLELKDNQFRAVEVTEGNIKDAFADFDAKEPSAGLFNLLTFLLDYGKQLANITDILTGDFPANASPTTVLAMIQQNMKNFKVIYQRVYGSLEEELVKIYEIIASHPELYAEEYKRYIDDAEADFKKDFDLESIDIMPAADAEVVLDSERMAKATILQGFIGNTDFNQFELIKRILTFYRIEDIDELLIKPQPDQPDPMAIALQQEAALEERKQANEAARIKVAEAETVLKTAKAKADTVKMDVEMDKIESEIELNKAKSIETLAKAGKEATLAKAEALYEPKRKQNDQ